ncbi:MAG: SET domain-containing protein-lysine N-methyltransferase [Chitinophagaceae bacterium]|nr:SET domain-containing protein-lysine N-methyltransferase [Chitinophagaceae bacterium]
MAKKLYLRNVKNKGRGVFCTAAITEGDDIEICPLLLLAPEDYDVLSSSHLYDYCFSYNREQNHEALALGFGSLYNHATDNNASYSINRENKTIRFYAIKDIPAHTEICVNYGGEPGVEYKKWFEDRGLKYIGS